MSELWFVLFSSKGIRKSENKVYTVLKILYLIYLLPFILFAIGMAFKSGAGSGNQKSGIIKKILVHFSAIFMALCFWIIIIQIISEKL